MHDLEIMPHMYDSKEMSKTFEMAVAPAELDRAPTGQCICSRPECRVCFPPPMTEFGPPVTNSEAWIIDSSEILSEKGQTLLGEIEKGQTLLGEVDCRESRRTSGTESWPRLLGPGQSS